MHLLFEFLAFHSDVSFWKNNKSLQGLSVRAVIIELFFQFIILLYLLDEDTSMLVVIPSAIGVCIQLWKVWRATGLTIEWRNRIFPTLRFARLEQEAQKSSTGGSSDLVSLSLAIRWQHWLLTHFGHGQARLTLQVDRQAVLHLSIVLFPLCVGFAMRSLIFEKVAHSNIENLC